MLKGLLEKELGYLISDKKFKQAMDVATDYIKKHKKITHLTDVLLVLEASIRIGK